MDRNVGAFEQIGSLLAGGALVSYGVTRGKLLGAMATLAGGAMIARGLTGKCVVYRALGIDAERHDGLTHPFNRTVHVRDSIAVNKPVEEVFAFWRDLSNLSRFMHDVEAVEQLDEKRSRWHACGPFDKPVVWEAEIVDEEPNALIRWRTVASESDLEHEGMVHFERLPGGRGTLVRLDFRWSPPAGVIGAAAAKLLPQDPARRVHEDLRRFRQLIEAGELSCACMRPERTPIRPSERSELPVRDVVEEAGIESFPASDAPAFTQ